MRFLPRTIVAIGALDLAYLGWVALGAFSGSGAVNLWQSTVAFGLPLPSLQVAAIVLMCLAILACGLALLFRKAALAWLNYVLFPLRVLLALPTLFPLFALISGAEVTFHPAAVFALLAVTETLRVILVHRWSRSTSAAAEVADAAA